MLGKPVRMDLQLNTNSNHVTQQQLGPFKPLGPMPPQRPDALGHSPGFEQHDRLIVRFRITSPVDTGTRAHRPPAGSGRVPIDADG